MRINTPLPPWARPGGMLLSVASCYAPHPLFLCICSFIRLRGLGFSYSFYSPTRALFDVPAPLVLHILCPSCPVRLSFSPSSPVFHLLACQPVQVSSPADKSTRSSTCSPVQDRGLRGCWSHPIYEARSAVQAVGSPESTRAPQQPAKVNKLQLQHEEV